MVLVSAAGCSSDDKNSTPRSDDPLIDSTTIDQAIGDFMASNPVAGMSVATIKKTTDSNLVWTSEYGFRDLATQSPVTSETSFWLGSVSKAIMGTTLMIANEKGFLQLDDDIHPLLTAQGTFSLQNPGMQPVTVANLASHTSGIIDNDEIYACAYFVPTDNGDHVKLVDAVDYGISCPDQSPVTLAGYLEAYLDSSGVFYSEDNFHQEAPGSRAEYSNIGAGLAGHMIELTTGQDLATFASQEIFSPLNMSHSSWTIGSLESANIATPYFESDGELTALPRYELATWPDGGLRSNAADLAKILGVVLNDGRDVDTGLQLLSETSIDRMLPAPGEEYGVFWSYEVELTLAEEERKLIGHSGSDPGAFSMMLFDPDSEVGIVVVGNGDDEEFDEASFETLLEALFKGAAAMQR